MPDTLSLSTGVSFGLLAGIVSGVCYLFANGVTWTKPEVADKRCLRAPQDEICGRCGGDKHGGATPCVCYVHERGKSRSEAWYLRQLQRAISIMPWSISSEKLEQIDEETDGHEHPGPSDPTRAELRKIREFLETISAKLAGGPLESTNVAPLYDHPSYLPAPRTAPQAPPTATTAHVQLKRLVARVVEEAAALPALARYAAEPHTPTIEGSTYEDLLATAILNKVIERYQNENGSGGRSSGIHSASASPTPSERSSPRSLHSRHTRDVTPPLHPEDVSDWEEGEGADEAVELPRRVPFPEFGGDIVHNGDNEEREFDEVSSSDLQAVDGSWEENWLFQKKKIKTQSVPVPMLVPNSNTEYRALIGDRDADDTTDLSDNASDAEEQDDYKSDMKKVLDSKHIIGGKTKVAEDFEPDSLTYTSVDEFEKLVDKVEDDTTVDAIINEINANSVTLDETINKDAVDETDSKLVLSIESGPVPKTEFTVKEEIHRALLNGSIGMMDEKNFMNGHHSIPDERNRKYSYNSNKESSNTLPLTSLQEREGEYEETVTIPVQRYADSLRRKHFEDVPHEIPTRDTDNDDELVPGSIAYRERKKWLNYVEMPNNPYSPEAIQKRLTTKSTSSLFDMFTKKDIDDDSIEYNQANHNDVEETPVKEAQHKKLSPTISNDSLNSIERKSKSPSPRILKDVVAEEIPQYKRYGRDYYIKEAKSSTGGRKKSSVSETSSVSSLNKSTSLDNMEAEFLSPGLLIKQFNTIATNQHYTKFAGKNDMTSPTTNIQNKDEILIDYEDTSDNVFEAKPVYLEEDTDKQFDEILETAYNTAPKEPPPPVPIQTAIEDKDDSLKSPISVDNSYISTSSLEDSIKIYNVQTGEIIKCKPEDNVSARYESDSNDNIDIIDKIAEDTVSAHDKGCEEVFDTNNDTITKSELYESEDTLPQLPKVKELAKKFVSMENITESVKPIEPYSKRRRSKENILSESKTDRPKQMYMHSLTARSISKQFREELKLSMSTPLTIPGGSKEIPEGAEDVTKESSRPGSPLPEPGTIKTKLAFFEGLKSKFSTK